MAAKKNNNALFVIGGIVLLIVLMGKQGTTPAAGGGSGGTDLSQVVSPTASFTAQRMFLSGTSITTEWVKIFQGKNDLGYKSTNSGTLDESAGKSYKFYFAENSTVYYTGIMSHTAPSQEGPDNVKYDLCNMDYTPTLTVFDEFGDTQGVGTAIQALSTDEKKDVSIRIRVSSDECFGNPDVNKQNAVCFQFNTTSIKSVETGDGDGAITAPFQISSNYSTAGWQINCYPFEKLKDNSFVDIPVSIESQSVEPTGDSNVTIFLDDAAFDINADNLEEIHGFEDEDNNFLGVGAVNAGQIRIS